MESQAPAFAAWLDDFFASYYRHRPVNATFIGVHEHDHRLPDFSEHGVGDALGDARSLLVRLDALPPEPLSLAEQIDRVLAEGFLRIQLWEFTSHHFQRGNPSLYTGEAVFGVMALFLSPFAPLAERVAAAIERLEAIPAFLAQGQENVRQAPAAWTQRAIRECKGARAFLTTGLERLIAEEQIQEPGLQPAAERAARAFARFQGYLEKELLRHPTDGYACGEQALDLILRQGHFLDLSAREIAGYAEEQLAQAEAYLAAHAPDFGASQWREALALLADDHPAPGQYYQRFSELWEAARATAIAHRLLTWPDFPLEYVPQPAWAREAAPYLYFLPYRAPAAFNRPAVHRYFVPPLDPALPPAEIEKRLRAVNHSVIKLNHVIHHGGIGHHVQNWHAYRAPSRIGQIAAVDCAARIAMPCGGTMAEGWACYATELMAEVGFLTPLERYAEYQTRLRMAARALVDIRLHLGQSSLTEAAAFYQERAGMSGDAAYNEAVKNSMFPGMALMYLLGTDMIRGLRRELAAREGDAFDLARFHDRFLSFGSIPVSLICAAMRSANYNAQGEIR
jgi:hypothetical protein